MKKVIFVLSLGCLFILVFTSCSLVNDVVKIPSRDQYVALDIQGVTAEGASSNETKKIIKDSNLINAFIKKVDGMKVIESKEKVAMKIKELNEKGNYIIALSDNEELQNGKLYYISMFNDGTFIFSVSNAKEMKFISEEARPKLVSEIKELLEINF
ncbi:hypothetical protein ACFSCX_19225 [Bacillus salitolerans]|uniref:Lipoprotein n=1 Tax=Bacillus salitolerans TaxID=1437434 RepID=A0ABW4LWW5_9BACI